jgi:hypothetical protein
VRGPLHFYHGLLAFTAPPSRRRWGRWVAVAALVVACGVLACGTPEPQDVPDEVLRRQLGLTDADRVRTVTVTGGEAERAEPALDSVEVGTYLQFVTSDWFVHEVLFELDSLPADARAFLERTDQTASPPLLHQDARFVVSFADAPPGRYPYRLEGNGSPGSGILVVVPPPR